MGLLFIPVASLHTAGDSFSKAKIVEAPDAAGAAVTGRALNLRFIPVASLHTAGDSFSKAKIVEAPDAAGAASDRPRP